MQYKALLVSLILALTVTAAPAQPKEQKGSVPDVISNVISPIVTSNKDTSNANGKGNGNGNSDSSSNPPTSGGANNTGNGNSHNQIGSENDPMILTDLLDINFGATDHQTSQEVVAAIKRLTLTCTSSQSGVMTCTWTG
ncbi:hypothetical protein HD806DRAFT_535471 [Xylariaceae sp. AK1471]|nr:hypothetical protein HD806DRAFT_535471 [Xylariaceae sp. AK1471]